MLKSCAKCGKIHPKGFICVLPDKQERNSQADKFRNTQSWRRKSEEIKTRDFHLCRICLSNMYNTKLKYNSQRLSVHHIIPLAEDFERRFDNDNLITLCSYHHELAERGVIPRRILLELAEKPPAL